MSQSCVSEWGIASPSEHRKYGYHRPPMFQRALRLPTYVLGPAAALALAVGCRRGTPVSADRYDPARDLGPLFHDVQLSGIFADSKTFVDARPRLAPAAIVARYASSHGAAGFSLQTFVEQNFELPRPVGEGFRTDTSQTMEQHIRALWSVLTRPPDTADERSSLIPIPNAYVVPGGRFREVYYWDSYFTMLGLIESGRTDLVRNMLDNFAYLVQTVGHIPNGNRTYYLSRSQPPFFAAMVGLYARATDTTQALRYLDALEAEYAFWMDGAERLGRAQAYRRVVRLPDASLLPAAYDPVSGFFYDVRWKSGERVTDRPTLAAASPLYFGLATPEQGRAVAARLERDFLKPGGFATTLIASGQQWDAPNGWPPLEWLTIEGVRRYGRADLADAARDRWLALNRRTYRSTGRMTEKYDVADLTRRAGGGEYPTQDGFGWSSGVALGLAAQQGRATAALQQ